MKSPNRYRAKVEPTVERLVYAVAIRAALEDLKPLLDGRRSVLVVFRLPTGADEPQYLTAGNFVMLDREPEERFDVLAPFKDRKGEVHFGDLISDIAETERALVMVNADVVLPSEIIAAADVAVDLEPSGSGIRRRSEGKRCPLLRPAVQGDRKPSSRPIRYQKGRRQACASPATCRLGGTRRGHLRSFA